MTDTRADHQGLGITRFSRPLSRTPFGARIALRGATCGEGFGVCLARLRHRECRFCPQRRNGLTDLALRVPLRLFRFGINRLDKPQRRNASHPHTYVRARHAHARPCAIACATVAALRRCAFSLLFLYLPEKKEEKQGFPLVLPATVAFVGVAAGVAAGLSHCFGCETLEKRGF